MSGNRDEKEPEETGSYETGVKAEDATRLRVTLASVLAGLPPSPGSLPGCSPNSYRSATPCRLPEAAVMDGDRILIENEKQNAHSRRPSHNEAPTIEQASPVKSPFSDIVRSIGSPNPSLASSGNSSPRRGSFSVGSDDNIVIGPWDRGMEISDRCAITDRDKFHKSEHHAVGNNVEGFVSAESNDSSKGSGKNSRSKVFPTAPGVAARDAFASEANHPSLPETPTPGEPSDPETKNGHMQNGTAGGSISQNEPDPETLFFRDGRRRIDMVLVYQEENEGVMTETEAKKRQQRKVFQENLLKEGLQLELEPKENSFDGKTAFLKLHIPWKVKIRYAELMNLKLYTKRFITISVKAWGDEGGKGKKNVWEKWLNWFNWIKKIQSWDTSLYPEEPSFYCSTDSGDREERFVVKDRETAYTPAQRSLIVMQILSRTRYDEISEKAGVRRLIADGSYLDCFPLHEGPYDRPGSDGVITDRHLLYLIWARPSQWYKRQPLWLIRRYFGEKVALYYAWLGFYTKALYPPAIVGVLCFIYGLGSMDSPDNIPTKEICDLKLAGNITLCPLCDRACSYRRLKDSCLFSRLTYLFDNPATVFFAIFMSFWATTFLELWKRRQAVIVWEWDLQNADGDEEPRPEFEATVKTFRINPVTREREPYLPAWTRALKFTVTGSLVFFMICVVLGAVLGTIIYRISLVVVFYGGGGEFLRKHAKIFTSGSAALLNLVMIMLLTRVYNRLALWMTNYENPRTQTEYEDSFTFKIFLFEFVNFYSSLIYIAFFKGRFYAHPGDADARSSEFFRIKTDVCDPAGCLSELCIQLAIIMIGKQCFNNFVEILSPKLWNWWRKRTHVAATTDHTRPYTYWEQDYQLQDPGKLALFDEYLEMIIQYGFVTLFVAAFPLAPFFALLNNIGEIRLDAYKMVKEARRPLAERVEDIGAWYGILKGVTYAAVVSNAFVIAYTSDFIPRSVYAFVYSPTNDLVGYIDSSLSEFNTSHFRPDMQSDVDAIRPETCQYRGYRNGPQHKDPYGLSPQYWHVFAARLAFVVVFEHVVFALTGIMSYAIPATPGSVATQLQRERLLAQEAKYEKGIKGREDEEDLISVLREAGHMGRAAGRRGSWARRFSKISDGLDAHVDIGTRLNRESEATSTVWEVT
ncbi:anoctamin-4 isoform X2 [Venturia canescens]|uniref:anoctamin-4 isoform X2 n=1 Tax=Venturia canescens TaxID=32260 RepID=UPI001C9CF92D|nr:anoctamin-4 isoform X2 [Venturia canescens]